ncbi:MAG: SAM-dependent methyltransferase [Lachnospiraceae bacterium]|jgi:tRNA (adenine22-N1)-methyltransferase|nr:SAM-dependent methyltransferase [Lachnospiraceae bacterium]
MQLSRRMQKLASLVTEGNRLADVGTDHGYIPIALVQAGKIPSAIAMDVNRGPLARAEAHIREAGLATYIETRLSDGLRELGAEDADTVLIAGMGGMLILRILTEGIPHLSGVEELILQPQSDVYRVRDWLQKHGYRVETEELVEEDGKYYPMMRAVRGQERRMEQAELYYGKAEVQRSPEVLRSYLETKLQEGQRILLKLEANGKEDTARAQEIKESMKMTGCMLSDAAKICD